jgi:uncharacterized membrane protein YdjX (TVP38/TMEM64 family)
VPPSPSRASAKVAVVVAAVAVVAGAHWLGVFERLAEPAQLARSLVELGAWGWVAFVVAYAVLQPFGVPGTVFIIAAPLLWPWPIAFALSMVGTMAASVIGFSFARFVARDWISSRIPIRFRKYDDALTKRAFGTVFTLRLIFWMPPLLHAFFGVSRVGGWTHFWASLAGYLLPLFLVSFFGARLFDAMKNAPLSLWIGAAAVVIVLGALAWAWQRHRRARAEVSVH